MKVAVGAVGGIAAQLGARYNTQFGPALGMGAVGFAANNDTLLTLAGMSLGQNLGGIFGGTTTSGGGY